MRARVLLPGVGTLATIDIDPAKMARVPGAGDRVVLVIDDPEAKGPERAALMLEGRLERIR
jgi:hypothetical protein